MSISRRTENISNETQSENSNPFSDKNATNDPNAPELYSPKAIYGFTFFFGVLFGGILFALNLKRINKSYAIFPVLVAAILFTAAQIAYVPDDIKILGMMTSMLAGLVYQHLLWPTLSGGNVKYRKRAIVAPVLTGIVLLAVFCLVYFLLLKYSI